MSKYLCRHTYNKMGDVNHYHIEGFFFLLILRHPNGRVWLSWSTAVFAHKPQQWGSVRPAPLWLCFACVGDFPRHTFTTAGSRSTRGREAYTSMAKSDNVVMFYVLISHFSEKITSKFNLCGRNTKVLW